MNCIKYSLLLLLIFCFMLTCSNPSSEGAKVPPIVINEFMVRNTIIEDPHQNTEDWVELYNRGADAVLLSGLYISDDPQNLLRKQLDDTLVPPGGYYLLWGGNSVDNYNNHIGFSFSCDTANGEKILLSNSDEVIVDSISYLEIPEACTPDHSYGRLPDGAASWKQQSTPTPGKPNEG